MFWIKILLLSLLINSYAYCAEVLDLVDKTHFGMNKDAIEKLYGKLKKSKSSEFKHIADSYQLAFQQQDQFLSITPNAPILFSQIKYEQFEMGPLIREGKDLIIGQIISVPERGLYMQVNPSSEIISFQWKAPWHAKKTIGKLEVQKKLLQLKVSKP